MKNNIAMEDIRNIMVDIIYLLEKQLELTEPEEDKLYDQLGEVLEKFCGYPDYRNYN